MKNIKIIFIGTPDFAVESLRILLHYNYNVVAVVTAVDKAAGRGLHIQKSAVKLFAEEQHLPILQPTNLKSKEFLNALQSYQADLQIVVAFRMLPEAVWAMPRLGTINVHASLLPNYRGAAPIHWAIIHGEKETGVSTFRLKHSIDTGNILLQKKVAIHDTDTTGNMYEKLKQEGANLLLATLQKIEENENYVGEEQQQHIENSTYKHAPKIISEHTKIDWNKKGIDIVNLIRGLCPHPAAQTLLQHKILKITQASFEPDAHQKKCGEIVTDQKTFLKFSCKDGFVVLHQLQLEGKKTMPVKDFLKGFKITSN